MYTVNRKRAYITLPNIDRFSKFFHTQNPQEISSTVIIIKHPYHTVTVNIKTDRFLRLIMQRICAYDIIPGENQGSHAVASSDRHRPKGQSTSQQQQQQQQSNDAETFRQSHLSSGKFNFNLINVFWVCFQLLQISCMLTCTCKSDCLKIKNL